MPSRKRQRVEPTEQWEQLELLFTSPEQRHYELIRPVVLFGQPAAQHARAANMAQRTVAQHAKLFLERGFATDPAPSSPRLPSEIREMIVALKAEHPPVPATYATRRHYLLVGIGIVRT